MDEFHDRHLSGGPRTLVWGEFPGSGARSIPVLRRHDGAPRNVPGHVAMALLAPVTRATSDPLPLAILRSFPTRGGLWRSPHNRSAETSARLACDSSRVVMRHDAGGAWRSARGRRTIPPALRRALQHRDHTVASPGAGWRSSRAITSVTGLAAGPPTLDLVLLCRRHHRAVHEDGYQVERDMDGRVAIAGGLMVASYPMSRRPHDAGRSGGHVPRPASSRWTDRARAHRDAGLAG